MSSVLNVLLLAEYVVSGLAALGVAVLVRRHLPYWPVLRLSFAVHLARGSYYAISVVLETQGRVADAAQMREVPYTLFLTTAVLTVMCWALYLVVKQNQVVGGSKVELTGHVQQVTPSEARATASRALLAAGEAEQAEHKGETS